MWAYKCVKKICDHCINLILFRHIHFFEVAITSENEAMYLRIKNFKSSTIAFIKLEGKSKFIFQHFPGHIGFWFVGWELLQELCSPPKFVWICRQNVDKNDAQLLELFGWLVTLKDKMFNNHVFLRLGQMLSQRLFRNPLSMFGFCHLKRCCNVPWVRNETSSWILNSWTTLSLDDPTVVQDTQKICQPNRLPHVLVGYKDIGRKHWSWLHEKSNAPISEPSPSIRFCGWFIQI